jgi:hypothetical protein
MSRGNAEIVQLLYVRKRRELEGMLELSDHEIPE